LALIGLIILLIGIWPPTFYASRMLHEDMERLLGEQQFSAVSLTAAQVNQEFDDRLKALAKVAGNITPQMMSNPAALQKFLDERLVFQTLFNGGAFITSNDGIANASIPRSLGRTGINYMDRDFIAHALKDGKTSVGRPVMGKKLRAPVIGIGVPIHDAQGKVIGALAGSINLNMPNFLDKVTDKPQNASGGYLLLVAPQHRLVVAASEKSRIMERTPDPGLIPAIDRFTQGYEGSAIYINPFGVEVLASAKGIPVAGWIMVSSTPTKEAFAPVHAMQQRVLLATILLSLLTGVLVWGMASWLVQRRLSPMIAATATLGAQAESSRRPQPLPIGDQDEIGKLIGSFNRLLETLAHREDALNDAQRIAKVGSWSLDLDSGQLNWSDEIFRLFEMDPQEFAATYEAFLNAIHPEDRAAVNKAYTASLASRTPFEIIHRLLMKDGRIKWVQERCVSDFDASGKPLRSTGTIQDITEFKRLEEAKIESQKILLTVLNSLDAIVYVADMDTYEVLFVNDFVKEAFGNIIGQPCWKTLQTGQSGPCAFCSNSKLLDAAGNPAGIYHWELQNTVNGHWYDARDRAIEWTDGRIVRLEIATDITERKETERALRESRERYQLLVETASEGILVAQGACLKYVNPMVLKITGYAEEELTSRPFLEFIHADDRELMRINYLKRLSGEAVDQRYPIRILSKDAVVKWIEISGARIEWEGQPATLNFVNDITEKRQAEESLRKSAEKYRELIQKVNIAVVIHGPDTRISDCNPMAQELLGLTEDQLLGKAAIDPAWHFRREDGIEMGVEEYPVSQVIARREPVRNLVVEVHRPGSRQDSDLWLLVNADPVFGSASELLQVIVTFIDITDRKRAEEEILRSNAELEQFSYAISHDMRQPLRMISGHLGLLERSIAERLDGDQRESFKFAIDGAKRMDAMMLGLLEYSRVGRKGEPPAWIESRTLLDEALLFLQPAIAEAQATVRIEGDWPCIFVSPDEMLRLVQNLIGNALKFRVAGRTPEVTVTSETVGTEWHMSVADNGVGILPDQIGRLFQVFQRLQGRTSYEGNGIGLALCRKIAEHHHGRIWAESAGEGQGSRFCVSLPQEGLGKLEEIAQQV
jgi:PAS domain S-box-containing protein